MKTESEKKPRHAGIDLLRIVSMFLVAVLHVLGAGGVLNALPFGVSYGVAWFMETAAFCAVNCYALISGYVGYNERVEGHKWSRYVTLWMQVVFYGVLITGVSTLFVPGVVFSWTELMKVLLPVSSGRYWYFTAYTALFVMMPYLNRAVQTFSKKDMTGLLLGCTVLFSVYSTALFLFHDPFRLSEGYSFLWLAVLYLGGAYIKKYEIGKVLRTRTLLLWGAGFLLFAWGWKMLFGFWESVRGGLPWSNIMVTYLSPAILGFSVVLLLLFIRMRISPFWARCIGIVAPATFGVYLWHLHSWVFANLIYGKFAWIAALPPVHIVLSVLGIAALIFIVGCAIDWVRMLLFRLCRADILSAVPERAVRGIIRFLCRKPR